MSTDGGTRGNRLGRGAPLRTAAAASRDNPSAAADSVAAADFAVFNSSRAETAAASGSSRATCDGRAGVAPTLASKREPKGKAGSARGAAPYKRRVEHEIATMQHMESGKVIFDVNPFRRLVKEVLLSTARDAGVDVACIEEDAHTALQVATEAVLLEAFQQAARHTAEDGRTEVTQKDFRRGCEMVGLNGRQHSTNAGAATSRDARQQRRAALLPNTDEIPVHSLHERFP